MIEANGTAGHEVTESIGDHGEPQEESRGGFIFMPFYENTG